MTFYIISKVYFNGKRCNQVDQTTLNIGKYPLAGKHWSCLRGRPQERRGAREALQHISGMALSAPQGQLRLGTVCPKPKCPSMSPLAQALFASIPCSHPVGAFFFSILLTYEGSHREIYRNFKPSLTSSAGGAKGCSDHRFRAPQPTLPDCWLCINTEPTTSIGRLIKSSRL